MNLDVLKTKIESIVDPSNGQTIKENNALNLFVFIKYLIFLINKLKDFAYDVVLSLNC